MENFIRGYFLENLNVCDYLISYFHKNPNKNQGQVFDDQIGKYIVKKNIKDSEDCLLEIFSDEYHIYTAELQKCINQYIQEFPYCHNGCQWGLLEKINLQYYPPGGGFYQWHCERSSGNYPSSSRHLVFMTYLNDVTDEGYTEFWHQNARFQPKKGLTLLWPADWTYTHRGVTSTTQEKYIITGWLSYLDYVEDKKITF